MSYLIKPVNYKPLLDMKQTELGIKQIKEFFQQNLSSELRLRRVTAPLFVLKGMGINDDLSGIERPVSFPIKDLGEQQAEVVHSLAKWKRVTLADYDIEPGYGIYTDMNAIRKDEVRDNYHSIYVDQWDYEVIINENDRNIKTLKKYVSDIYSVIRKTELYTEKMFNIKAILPEHITFITSEELLKKYPNLNPSERVNAFIKEVKACFVIGIGYPLSDGKPQDLRAPDYDDWDLNGDIYVYNPLLNDALELSSMGIRVNKDSLVKQINYSNKLELLNYKFQKKILNDEVPLTLGGGIGQSRLCMFMLKKLHIGEVQSSIWKKETREFYKNKGVTLL